nr:hypothetical protein [Tanacetum cinerariifolium]
MIFNESWKKHVASLISEINNKSFEVNDLKARLQEKSIVVYELMQLLTKLKGKSQVTQYETTNLVSRAQLHAKIIRKFITKVVEKNDLSRPITSRLDTNTNIEKNPKVFAHGLFRLKSGPINGYFMNNKLVHKDYLNLTNEHLATLQELLEQDRALKSLNANLDYACKFGQRIQELLVYVCASCPFSQSENKKWAPTTSHKKNNKPYVDTSSLRESVDSNAQKFIVKQNKQKTNTPLLPSTRIESSTFASGSKPRSNTRIDRIPQPSSSSPENKLEVHHRKFKSISNKNHHVSDCNANVKNVMLKSNSKNVCLTCNECLFSANYNACVLNYLNDVQNRKNAKFVKQKEKIEWKQAGRIFTTVVHKWLPTGRTFSLCLAKYKLSVNFKVRRALFITPRTAKCKFLDTTPVVAKTKSVVVTHLNAKIKVGRDNDEFHFRIPVPVKKWIAKLFTLPYVFSSCIAGYTNRIMDCRTWKVMVTIHVKFDELTTMAYENNCLEPATNRFNVEDSSAESNQTPSKENDSLFGPLYKEYYKARQTEVSTNFVAPTTLNNEDTPTSSTIIVDDNDAPPLVSTSEEPTSSISNDLADESIQEDSVELDKNTFIDLFFLL